MAAAVKNKLSRVTSGFSSTPDPSKLPPAPDDGYRLLVTAGPSYDRSLHHTVTVNSPDAVYVENEFLRAKIKVRIRAYRGFPSSSPHHSPYFDDPVHEKDQYSVAFSFVPKVDIPSLECVWGNDFDHPIREKLPPGFNTAFRIVKEWIDPALNCDAYADEPWLYGPPLSSWFAFRIGEIVKEGEDFPAPEEDAAMKEGAEGSGQDVRDRVGMPENSEKRRKFFQSSSNREGFSFEKGRLYMADFYNPYIDFSNRALRLPGFTMKVTKYLEHKSHLLRYVFKNRGTGEVYVNVNFNLLWGEELSKAEGEEEKMRRGDKGAMVGGGVAGNPGLDGHEEEEGRDEEDGHEEEGGRHGGGGDGRDEDGRDRNVARRERDEEGQAEAGVVAAPPPPAAAPERTTTVDSSEATAGSQQGGGGGGGSIMDMLKSTATADARFSGKGSVVHVEDELD